MTSKKCNAVHPLNGETNLQTPIVIALQLKNNCKQSTFIGQVFTIPLAGPGFQQVIRKQPQSSSQWNHNHDLELDYDHDDDGDVLFHPRNGGYGYPALPSKGLFSQFP